MKQLALGRPPIRTWQEGGTETRDASTISTGPQRTAHQATVGKTSFSTPWGTLGFFSLSSSFTISVKSFLWFLKAWGSLGKPWWPRLNMRWWIFISKCWFMRVTFGWVLLAQKTLCNGTINIVSKVSLNFGCLFLRNCSFGWEAWLLVKRWICSDYISILSQH